MASCSIIEGNAFALISHIFVLDFVLILTCLSQIQLPREWEEVERRVKAFTALPVKAMGFVQANKSNLEYWQYENTLLIKITQSL